MTEESTDSLEWFTAWPHDKIAVIDKWREVHFRYGLAAQQASLLEIDLVLLLVDLDIKSKGKHRFEDSLNLIMHFAQKVRLLGRLICELRKRTNLSDDFQEAIDTALRQRNYLIHHFYRVRAGSFKTPSGCDEMAEELATIKDDIEVAVDYLHDLTEELIRPKMSLEDMLVFIDRHGKEYGLDAKTFMERYKTLSAKIPEQVEHSFRGNR